MLSHSINIKREILNTTMNHFNTIEKAPKIELLGIGSAKNRALKANLETALSEMGVSLPIEEVREVQQLLKYDIIGIPALVVDGKVIFQKVVPDVEDLKIVLNILFSNAEREFRIKNILVPTDFSDEAENTLKYAISLAKVLDARIDLLHVLPSDLEVSPLPVDNIGATMEKDEDVRAALVQFARSVSNGSAKTLKEMYVRIGLVTEEILDMSRKPEVDLIILGAKGKGGGLEKWFGNVATTVARRAECPVLIVPGDARFEGLDKLVYASDFHPAEEKTLPQVVQFANEFNASIHFVHVIENYLNGYLVDSGWPGKRFQFENTPFSMTSVECNDIAEGLNRFAKEKGANLMVMTTGKRNFFEELFHRSVTQRMVYNSEIPLLVMHFDKG